MLKSLSNPQWWLAVFFAIIAGSSSYNSYKLYQLTDAKVPVAKKR